MNKKNDRFLYILEKYIKEDTQKILTYITPSENDFIFNNCRKFNYINILCVNPEQEELVKETKCKNIRTYTGNITDNLNKLSHDVVFISVNNSNLDKDGKLNIDGLELTDIINNYGNIIIVFIHATKGGSFTTPYNLSQIMGNIKYPEIDIYGQGDKSQGFYMIIKKN